MEVGRFYYTHFADEEIETGVLGTCLSRWEWLSHQDSWRHPCPPIITVVQFSEHRHSLPCHDWHLEPDNSWLWGSVLCVAGCFATSFLCLQGASSNPPTYISKHCLKSPVGQNHLWLKTTWLMESDSMTNGFSCLPGLLFPVCMPTGASMFVCVW